MWEIIAWVHIVAHIIDKVLDQCERELSDAGNETEGSSEISWGG